MMDKIYYHYTEVLLYYGIFSVIIKILIYSGFIIYEYENNIEDMLPRLKTYFTETNVWVIIFFQFLYMIIDGFIYCILLVQILYYLRPNYLIIDDEITNYSGDLFGDNENRFYTLIPFLLQILLMLFYFEILEFNYCDLNKNTAKNIEIREENESKNRTSDASIIELNSQYISLARERMDAEDDVQIQSMLLDILESYRANGKLSRQEMLKLDDYLRFCFDKSAELFQTKKWLKDFMNNGGFSITGSVVDFKPEFIKGKTPMQLVGVAGESLKQGKQCRKGRSYYSEKQ